MATQHTSDTRTRDETGTLGTKTFDTNGQSTMGDDYASLFSEAESSDLRARWESVQAQFVDDPKQAVQHADELVSDVTDRIVDSFQQGRSRLEEAWADSDEVSTELLRTTLQRYRSYFNRLLTISE